MRGAVLLCVIGAVLAVGSKAAEAPVSVVSHEEALVLLEVASESPITSCGGGSSCPPGLPGGGVCCPDGKHCCIEKCVMVAQKAVNGTTTGLAPQCRYNTQRTVDVLQKENKRRQLHILSQEKDLELKKVAENLAKGSSPTVALGKIDKIVKKSQSVAKQVTDKDAKKLKEQGKPVPSPPKPAAKVANAAAKNLKANSAAAAAVKAVVATKAAKAAVAAVKATVEKGATATAAKAAAAAVKAAVAKGATAAAAQAAGAAVKAAVAQGAAATATKAAATAKGAEVAAAKAQAGKNKVGKNKVGKSKVGKKANATVSPQSSKAIIEGLRKLVLEEKKHNQGLLKMVNGYIGALPKNASASKNAATKKKNAPKKSPSKSKLSLVDDTMAWNSKAGKRLMKKQQKRLKAARKKRKQARKQARKKKEALKNLKLNKRHFKNFGHGYPPLKVDFKEGLCWITGVVTPNVGVVATLPKKCRPVNGDITFNALEHSGHNDDWPVRIEISSSGQVKQKTTLAKMGDRGAFVSYSGIVYAPNGGKNVTLADGWSAPSSTHRSAQVNRIGPLCVLSGRIEGQEWGVLGELPNKPKSCKPDARLFFSVDDGHAPMRVDIAGEGNVTLFATDDKEEHRADFVNLDGMMWAAEGGRSLNLHDHWSDLGDTYRGAVVRRVGRVVMLSGAIHPTKQGGVLSRAIARLPKWYAPETKQVFGTSHGRYLTRVEVHPDGLVTFTGNMRLLKAGDDFSGPRWLSLTGISYVISKSKASKPSYAANKDAEEHEEHMDEEHMEEHEEHDEHMDEEHMEEHMMEEHHEEHELSKVFKRLQQKKAKNGGKKLKKNKKGKKSKKNKKGKKGKKGKKSKKSRKNKKNNRKMGPKKGKRRK